ncbi:MAG: TrbC/VirB2 family protein [Minisyncoccia bacterium]
MNFIKKSWWKLILAFYVLVVPIASLVADVDGTPSDQSGKIINPLENSGINSIPALIEKVLEGVLKIGIPIVALAIIYSGFLFVFARGNSEKLGKAKDSLLYTIIGAAILLGSWAIAKMISSTVLAL